MDIEGAEFRNLLNCDAVTIKRFRIIALELHGLRAFMNASKSLNQIESLLQVINSTHTCVHAHPNNYAGDFIEESTGMNIPSAMELTFLRNDRYGHYSGNPLFSPMVPHPLDISRNVAGKPPIHLNKLWSHTGDYSVESQIKILEDEIEYRRYQISRLRSGVASPGSSR
jgi:hypothetical protein